MSGFGNGFELFHCQYCNSLDRNLVFSYTSPPPIEVRFNLNGQTYYRELQQCETCLHFYSIHSLDLAQLYSGNYVDSNYGGIEGIRKTFKKIMSLPHASSDNRGRIQYIATFVDSYFGHKPIFLDVGSGTGVFPYGIKEHGYSIVALDPDSRAAKHLEDDLKIKTYCGDFFKAEIAEKFDVVTFNKVLEHVVDPIAMLKKARSYLKPGGLVYVELPDGETASRFGSDREEFLIDHFHAFSFTSWGLLLKKAGFESLTLQRLVEPSGKYTLRGFGKVQS